MLRFGATGAAEQLPLLQRVLPWLPPQMRVCFYADSEFRTLEMQLRCQQQHWHWQVGLHNSLLFKAPDGDWQSLKCLELQPGERRYLQNVWLGCQQAFGTVNLIADWAPSETDPHYWAVDLPADPRAWRRGRKRFQIEPTFRDWKSYGFDLEAIHIRDVDRPEHLLLGLALTTVWLMPIGEWLTHSGRRYQLARRISDYSLLRLGRDYLERTRTVPGHIPVGLTLAGWA